MSGRRLEPDREAERKPWLICYWPLPEPTYRIAEAPASEFSSKAGAHVAGPLSEDDARRVVDDRNGLLAELDAVRADSDSAYADAATGDDNARAALERAEKAEASLALVEGQAHRATQDVLALRRIATAAKALTESAPPFSDSAAKQALWDALAGWGDATRGAEDER